MKQLIVIQIDVTMVLFVAVPDTRLIASMYTEDLLKVESFTYNGIQTIMITVRFLAQQNRN